ncbi:MAG: bifunctional [glutamine synthetase] adenylyltransferase/[glutamine synthetase]-adenylyl-L-tyrosine phosphorylase [Hyphomicrobiales bacterium]
MSSTAGHAFQSLPVDDEERARERVEEFFDRLTDEAQPAVERIKADPARFGLLQAAICDAPFIRDCLLDYADFAADLIAFPQDEKITDLIKEVGALDHLTVSESELMRALRGLKRKMALGLALFDLGRVWPMECVTEVLSKFADATLLAAIRFALFQETHRGKLQLANEAKPEEDSGLIVLAMGKHGAFELNYSSDIDIIVFYEAGKVQITDRFELQPSLVRVTKRIVKILQERTEHGYVFRTDLRLRPDPGATAVAISTEAAINYYESIGQNWERAAFIKARPVSCDIGAAEAFLSDISPFIWRKYMDFAMIADVHAMKRQTHLHKGHATIALAGHNVKLGRGGIREIEFFVQTQQLIAGGRNSQLRVTGTLEGLKLLAEAGWIDDETAKVLATHYRFLRNVEHRIQMRFDEQTHALPKDDEAFEAIGRLMGFETRGEFDAALLSCFQSVSSHYANLFEADDEQDALSTIAFPADNDDPATLKALEELGFENSMQVSSIIRQWQSGHYKAMRSEKAREALAVMLPKLLASLARNGAPDSAIFTFDEFLKNLPAGVQLFGLLKANDHLLDLLASLMGSAPRLAQTIARRPHIFDALLEPAFFGSIPTSPQLKEQLAQSFEIAIDYQDCLDRARVFVEEQRFLIGTRLLSGTITPQESQLLYSDLADVVTVGLMPLVVEEVARNHGYVSGADITILAMGKLGGREMSPTSDLDLILIYDVDPDVTESDGRRPIAVTQYFARITQRFIAALSAPMGEGIAYEVDMRLRPSGKAGPLATEVTSFIKYQNEAAWTWEHMALTRARVIGGSDKLCARINRAIDEVVNKPRDLAVLRKDVAEMNERLHEAKEARTVFGMKEARGGLVDIEFITQFIQLAESNNANARSTNTRQALMNADVPTILPDADKDTLLGAFDLFSDLIQLMRLCMVNEFDPDTAPDELKERLFVQADMPDFARLIAHLEESQTAVRSIYEKVLAQ